MPVTNPELFTRVESVVAEFRPVTQSHGGDIELVEIDDQRIARVKLKGACHGCPAATETLRFGLEQMLRAKVPEIGGVEQVKE
jgi:Fe-S cluster biogenesis protein NfuA